jgi:hypothetical protein
VCVDGGAQRLLLRGSARVAKSQAARVNSTVTESDGDVLPPIQLVCAEQCLQEPLSREEEII